jgi:excisionase family DNA binding protein
MRVDDDIFDPIRPSEAEATAIHDLYALLLRQLTDWSREQRNVLVHADWRLLLGEGEPRPLSPSVMRGLLALCMTFSRGESAAVVPLEVTLTTQEAADLLGVSRPHVIRLLEQGALPFERVGSHRRIRAEDVVAYRRRRQRQRRFALAALTEENARLGLYSRSDEEDPPDVDNLDRSDDPENRPG